MNLEVLRPEPYIDDDTRFFWEGLKSAKIYVQKCRACQNFRHPPSILCRNCQSTEWDLHDIGLLGTIYSFVIVHSPRTPTLKHPNIVVLVEMKFGVRIIGSYVGNSQDIAIGKQVIASFFNDSDKTYLQFNPMGE